MVGYSPKLPPVQHVKFIIIRALWESDRGEGGRVALQLLSVAHT